MSDQAAANRLTLTVERCSDFTVVHCSGRLVAGVNDRLYSEVSQLIPCSKRIVLELAELTTWTAPG